MRLEVGSPDGAVALPRSALLLSLLQGMHCSALGGKSLGADCIGASHTDFLADLFTFYATTYCRGIDLEELLVNI